MQIAIIGVGHVGLVTAATLAEIGHVVVGFDDDPVKVGLLRQGKAPFFEPGLQDLLDKTIDSGRLTFADSPDMAIPGREVAFICVGTPGNAEGEANLVAVEQAATSVGQYADREIVVVGKSTVPVQTAERLKTIMKRTSNVPFHVVSNPEFLREGKAVEDSLHPERILVGAETEHAQRIMRELYAPLLSGGVNYFATDLATAELAKHACNAFLALKVSYANALARVCELSGADVIAIADIMGSDSRIGREHLDAGLGYGGYCFPKDVLAFGAQAKQLGYEFGLLDEVRRLNDEAVDGVFELIKDAMWNLEGKRIAMLGLSFKPGTDDVRESPALNLATRLISSGAKVVGYDPAANDAAKKQLDDIDVVGDPYEAAEGAHCIVVATAWPEFAQLDLPRLKGILNHPIIVDGRNLLDAETVAAAGFTYIPVGRPALNR